MSADRHVHVNFFRAEGRSPSGHHGGASYMASADLDPSFVEGPRTFRIGGKLYDYLGSFLDADLGEFFVFVKETGTFKVPISVASSAASKSHKAQVLFTDD